MHTRLVTVAVTLGTALFLCAAAANAATCREELQQFERKLGSSSLAVDEPEKFANLAREAEAAAELRDEDLCLQQVAELNAALPAASPAAPAEEPGTQTNAVPAERAPPKPPVLLEAAPVDFEAESARRSDPDEADHDTNPQTAKDQDG
ncbi:MAG: hypothetical protein ACREQ8_09830 [Woeseiaceae bacterium]